jgi:hypothetical protein
LKDDGTLKDDGEPDVTPARRRLPGRELINAPMRVAYEIQLGAEKRTQSQDIGTCRDGPIPVVNRRAKDPRSIDRDCCSGSKFGHLVGAGECVATDRYLAVDHSTRFSHEEIRIV